MQCPFCGAEDTKVIDSRQVEAFQVKRRRSCGQCERRFTTIEARQLNMPKLVKSSGYLESFDEEKLRAGLLRALVKRPIENDVFESLVKGIMMTLQQKGVREIQAKEFGDIVMEALRAVDLVAYVRFASVYQSFQDLQSFQELLEQLSRKEVVS